MDVRIDVLSEFVPFRNKKTADNPLPTALSLNSRLSTLNSQLSSQQLSNNFSTCSIIGAMS